MKKKVKFIRLLRVWGILFLMVLGMCYATIDTVISYRDLDFRANEIRSETIDRQKQIIKREVIRVVDMIRYEKSRSEEVTRKKIQSRVYEAYAVARHIYETNKDAEPREKIEQMVTDALRPIRFENGVGYYFATRFDGVEMLFSDRPQMEGLNLLDMKDTRGQYVIRDMIEIARGPGEGFYEYHWTKPKFTGNEFKKISFVKRFEPWDWFIGTGLYVEDIEHQIKEDLLTAISKIRFGKEGYVFVNRLNGDALVSNGRRFSGTKKLWEVFGNDPENMKAIFQQERRAAEKPDGDFIYYSHVKLTDPQNASPKVSFIFGVPELNWLVGGGVYLDDLEADIALMQAELKNQIKTKMLYLLFVVTVILGLFFLLFSWLNNRLRGDLHFFVSFLNRAAQSDEKIDRGEIKFEEFDQMAQHANKMLADRRLAEDALRKSEEKWRHILVNTPQLCVSLNPGGKIVFANEHFQKLIGYDEAEIQSQDGFDLFVPENKHKEAHDLFTDFLRNNPDFSTFEYDILTKEGQLRHIAWASVPTKDTDGQISEVTCLGLDLTEKIKLEEQLRQAKKMESIGTLAGGIAHDFNNILSAIIGYTELAQMKSEADAKIHHYLKGVLDASTRAKNLIQQILTFSRQTKDEKKPVHLHIILQEALKLLRSTLPTTIDIRTTIQSDSVVLSDPTQLHQIIMNLCTNAAHAMGDKGGTINISLDDVDLGADFCSLHPEVQPGAYQRLTVGDTGCGMTPETLGQIFDPFFTTKEKGDGTGLGLSVVHGIVKSCGGMITVDSRPHQGTVFSIYFPIIASHVEEEVKEKKNIPTGTEHILIVDDEKAIIDITRRHLSTLGYTVTTMSGGREALSLFKANPAEFDLVITDMTMPQMTGDILARELMTIRPEIPVILCTGFSDKVNGETAKQIGIKALLIKPLLREEMANIVRRVLDGAKDVY